MRNTTKYMIPRGKPDLPTIATCHTVRYLVVCAYARCCNLGDQRNMITTRAATATTFQSTSDGRACYHGRCYAKQFGVDKFLRLPKKQLSNLTLGDVGPDLARAIMGVAHA